MAIWAADLTPRTEGLSIHDSQFKYTVGAWVKPKSPFDGDIRTECASGIHCFITFKEAEDFE
jgi:hypothetical protein